MGTSKNSKKGSKPVQIIREKKEKPKKQIILIEVTNTVADELKNNKDLSVYHDMPVIEICKRYGKSYLKVSRE